MIPNSRLRSIQFCARKVLADEGRLSSLPIRPKELAQDLGITLMPFSPPQPDISGFLMRVGNSFGIGYSSAIKSEGFQNFTVAHELGHYYIDDHPSALLSEGKHFSRSGYISKDRYEREADVFASELLMPWSLVNPLVTKAAPGLEGIKLLSESCESSLVAASIRYCELTSECVAAVVSFRGAVEFMTASPTFKHIPGLDWLRKREQLPDSVPSCRLSLDTTWIRSCSISQEGSYLNQWFPNAAKQEVEEDVVGLGSYERTLTILITDPASGDDVEEEEEESDDYIERWKDGRFRPKK